MIRVAIKMDIDINDCNATIKPLEEFSPIVNNSCLEEQNIIKGVRNLTELVDWFRNKDRIGWDLETWKTMKDEVINCTSERQKPCTGLYSSQQCIDETQIYADRINSCANKVYSVFLESMLQIFIFYLSV